MERLHFNIKIEAPKNIVWETMLGEHSFKKWTEPFAKGSHYKGNWNKGSKMTFLAPGEGGKMEGMVSRIKDNRKHKFLSIEHIGIIKDGKEVTSGEEVKNWSGALENYTLIEKNQATEVMVDMDTGEEYKEMMLTTFPKALKTLKELAEKAKPAKKSTVKR